MQQPHRHNKVLKDKLQMKRNDHPNELRTNCRFTCLSPYSEQYYHEKKTTSHWISQVCYPIPPWLSRPSSCISLCSALFFYELSHHRIFTKKESKWMEKSHSYGLLLSFQPKAVSNICCSLRFEFRVSVFDQRNDSRVLDWFESEYSIFMMFFDKRKLYHFGYVAPAQHSRYIVHNKFYEFFCVRKIRFHFNFDVDDLPRLFVKQRFYRSFSFRFSINSVRFERFIHFGKANS